MESKKIEIQAQEIMDNFLEAMKDIEVEEEFISTSKNCYRDEDKSKETNEEFKEQFLKNAPKSKGDAIVANKGSWV